MKTHRKKDLLIPTNCVVNYQARKSDFRRNRLRAVFAFLAYQFSSRANGGNMVQGAGTDTEYSRDIPIRVSHLETSVNQLHVDNQRTQTTLAGIVAHQEAQSKVLSDIAGKLDATRTARPNLVAYAMIALAAVGTTFTYSELRLAPVYREMDTNAKTHEVFNSLLNDRSTIIADSAARLKHVEGQADSLEERMLDVEANRFSKQDGQRLEELLRAEIQRKP